MPRPPYCCHRVTCSRETQRCPDITGSIELNHASNAGLIYSGAEATGALCKIGSANVVPNGVNAPGAHLGIDAALSNALYGGSNSVTPSSVFLLFAIKS